MNVNEARERINHALTHHKTKLYLDSLGESSNLKQADLTNLVPDILKIHNLQELYLSNNNITEIPLELFQLQKLQTISIAYNEICEIPKQINQLRSLREFTISGNKISHLPNELFQLQNLYLLNLAYNQISELPQAISKLQNLHELYLHGNSALENEFHSEILREYKNPKKIINYYFRLKAGRTSPINEAKIVIIGEANVGKTCLKNRLVFDSILPTNSTHGIEICQWDDVCINGENIQLNVWDFGGQELMHSTHQFFFTNRTVYILVANARENEDNNKIEEWLKRVESFAGNSPVIIVGNKIDHNDRTTNSSEIGYFDINRNDLRNKFRNIKGFYGLCTDTVNVKDSIKKQKYDEIFTQFKDDLLMEVGQLDELHKPFPDTWFAVKEKLEKMQENNIPYISYNQYIKDCINEDITDEISQTTIVEFLNQIGTVIYFNDLPDTMVFNPEWITKGVYAIIDNPTTVKNKGELDIGQLAEILNQKEYPKEKHKFILDIMRKFELCIDIEFNNKFLIPVLLPLDEVFTGEWENSLYFQFEYETYLKNIFTKFIVRLFPYICQKTYWRNGVVLEFEDSKALVKADTLGKRITIQVIGSNIKKRQNLLAIIRKELKQINSLFRFAPPNEFVAHPNYNEILKDYEELLGMEQLGQTEVYIKELERMIRISDFLDGVASKEDRKKMKKKGKYINMIKEQYNVNNSQVGAVGDNNKISDNIFNQQNNISQNIDFNRLLQELKILREFLVSKASETEHYILIGNIANAEKAAEEKDSKKVIGYLKSAGNWVLEAAKEVGVNVVTDLIKNG